jgi:hypothetical protein
MTVRMGGSNRKAITTYLREVLEFLVPFINPKKPNQMTVQVASMVLDCLINMKKVSWAKVFEQSIRMQVEIVSVTYLLAYAIDLYIKKDLLSKTKKKEYDALK